MRFVPALIAVLTVTRPAFAAEGFQGATWAMTPDQARAALTTAKCLKAQRTEAAWRVTTCRIELMGAPTVVSLRFLDGGLRQVEVMPVLDDQATAWAIYDALVIKYGEPEGQKYRVDVTHFADYRVSWPKAYLDLTLTMSWTASPVLQFTYSDPVYAEELRAAAAAKLTEVGKGL